MVMALVVRERLRLKLNIPEMIRVNLQGLIGNGEVKEIQVLVKEVGIIRRLESRFTLI